MGFFQDLKEDLSQAVNELMPDDDKKLEKNAVYPEMEQEPEVSEESEEIEAVHTKAAVETAKEEEQKGLEDEQISEDLEEALLDAQEQKDEDEELKILEQQLKELEAQENEKQLQTEISDTIEEIPNEVVEQMLKSEETVGEVLDKVTDMSNDDTIDKERYKKMPEQSTKLTGVATDETSIITSGMTINGNVSSKGSIEVVGTIVGDVETLGKLDVTGTIKGNSKAAEVYAESARINGEIRSEGSIKIGQSSVIIGNIFAKSAVIAGAVKGDIDVQGPVVLDTSAIVMGNIKSKSVQINNGAVIEGLCSQCYAEVNPTAFFEDYK